MTLLIHWQISRTESGLSSCSWYDTSNAGRFIYGSRLVSSVSDRVLVSSNVLSISRNLSMLAISLLAPFVHVRSALGDFTVEQQILYKTAVYTVQEMQTQKMNQMRTQYSYFLLTGRYMKENREISISKEIMNMEIHFLTL